MSLNSLILRRFSIYTHLLPLALKYAYNVLTSIPGRWRALDSRAFLASLEEEANYLNKRPSRALLQHEESVLERALLHYWAHLSG